MYLLIDGYNLIHADGGLWGEGSAAPEPEALAEALRLYRKKRPHKITLVLDGGPGPSGGRTSLCGIPVIYSGAGCSADDVIAGIAAAQGSGVTVITDDRELGQRCRRHGAEIIGAREFALRLKQAAFEAGDVLANEEEPAGGFGTRKKGPSRRAPKARRRKERRLNRL
jgi:predicted RNA-binding protein with PIN domain